MSEQSERKLVTVLFADLTGSTALADEQDPERTRARLARFYDAMKAEIEAKGKPAGIRCRNVVRALSLMRTRGLGGLARVFVGRDAELGRLRSAYQRAVQLEVPVLVTVVGDAGAGKTRIVRELWEQLGGE